MSAWFSVGGVTWVQLSLLDTPDMIEEVGIGPEDITENAGTATCSPSADDLRPATFTEQEN